VNVVKDILMDETSSCMSNSRPHRTPQVDKVMIM